MEQDRRTFLKKLATVSLGANLVAAAPVWADNESGNTEQAPTESSSFELNILQTTDVHCQVHPHDELFWENDRAVFRKTGGYAQIATLFKEERKNNAHTFIVDTGDMFQGSELSTLTTGNAMVPILNELGYDLYLPGNWEVIYYKKGLQSLLGALTAPKICANMYHDLGDGKRGDAIFPPYYIWKAGGVKIGFIGYTDPYVPVRQPPACSKGIVYGKPEENLSDYVTELKHKEQCDYIILLAHLGLSQQVYLANLPACEGVNYILGGDTHERVREPIVCKYAKVVEPGAFGSFIGKLVLTVKNGKVIKDSYQLLEVQADSVQPDKKVNDLITQNEKPFLESIHKVVGYSTIPLYRYFVVENPIDTLLLDALHWQLKEVDIVLSNGFRFCPPMTTPDHTGNIPITEGYLYDMFPVNSTLKTGSVTGKQLEEWMERELNNVFAINAAERLGGWVVKFKGMEVSFNAFGEKGKRVQRFFIGGKPLDVNRIYTISACEREGDPEDALCRIKGVKNVQITNHKLHGVLTSYLAVHSPVTPIVSGIAKVLDTPPSLLTQVTGFAYQFR